MLELTTAADQVVREFEVLFFRAVVDMISDSAIVTCPVLGGLPQHLGGAFDLHADA